jgi:carbonic anhydrase
VKKLIKGIVEFRRGLRPEYRETFRRLAIEQKPDTLFIACSDSRVVPNLFASTEPGDLFVIRNVGNLVPPDGSAEGEAEAAALEFALGNLPIEDIVVCGHSECGAMRALSAPVGSAGPALLRWLEVAKSSLGRLEKGGDHNALSKANVLQQLAHLRGYPEVAGREKAGKLRLHAWWFDIRDADVYAYDAALSRWTLIDESEAKRLLARLES